MPYVIVRPFNAVGVGERRAVRGERSTGRLDANMGFNVPFMSVRVAAELYRPLFIFSLYGNNILSRNVNIKRFRFIIGPFIYFRCLWRGFAKVESKVKTYFLVRILATQ